VKERPTGIIRTLPSLEPGHVGRDRYEASIKGMDRGEVEMIYIALPALPKTDVLHMYLLVEGKVEVRLNIAEYVKGGDALRLKCWDGVTRTSKFWAVCTGPVSRPPEPIARRGFQGFRYTGDLW
jgi:hypothetical protein